MQRRTVRVLVAAALASASLSVAVAGVVQHERSAPRAVANATAAPGGTPASGTAAADAATGQPTHTATSPVPSSPPSPGGPASPASPPSPVRAPSPPGTTRLPSSTTRSARSTASGTARAVGSQARPFKGVAGSACADSATRKAAWFYTWWIDAGTCPAPGFVPMISGKTTKTPTEVSSALSRIAAAGYRTVLGFNEPNKTDQANLTVAQAIALWPSLTANPAVRVGSPATSADAQGWFSDFMAQAQTRHLRVDFIALHWYGWAAGSCDANATELERYLRWAEALPGGRPIWITELGCMNASASDPTTVQRFYVAATAMIARHPRVERYAWYPWLPNNALVDSSGSLTPLGRAFAAAPAAR